MTSQAKSGRGGRRPGAGRKPKGYVKPSSLSELDKIAALATEPPEEIDGIAARHAREVIESLGKLLFYAASEAAKRREVSIMPGLSSHFGQSGLGTVSRNGESTQTD